MALSSFNDEIRGLQRLLVGHADEVDMDGAGASSFRPRCASTRASSTDIVLVGQGNKFELWDDAKWHEQTARAITFPGGRSAARTGRLQPLMDDGDHVPVLLDEAVSRAGDPAGRHVRRRDVRPRRARARDPRRGSGSRDGSSRSTAIPTPNAARERSPIRAFAFRRCWFSELPDALAELGHRARRRRRSSTSAFPRRRSTTRRAASRFAPTGRSTCGWIPRAANPRPRSSRARDSARNRRR